MIVAMVGNLPRLATLANPQMELENFWMPTQYTHRGIAPRRSIWLAPSMCLLQRRTGRESAISRSQQPEMRSRIPTFIPAQYVATRPLVFGSSNALSKISGISRPVFPSISDFGIPSTDACLARSTSMRNSLNGSWVPCTTLGLSSKQPFVWSSKMACHTRNVRVRGRPGWGAWGRSRRAVPET